MEKSPTHIQNLIKLLEVVKDIIPSPKLPKQDVLVKLNELHEIKSIKHKIWKIDYYNNPKIFVRLYSAELKYII